MPSQHDGCQPNGNGRQREIEKFYAFVAMGGTQQSDDGNDDSDGQEDNGNDDSDGQEDDGSDSDGQEEPEQAYGPAVQY